MTRDGWNRFIGANFTKDSFCIKGERGDGSRPRSCGNGEEDPPGCYRFDELNRAFKLSNMLVESVANEESADPESVVLSADELWTPKCNLVRDMLGLANIDPHVMLVIFLPALLFESAAFGIDMGLFLKQKFQILTMAFPAMVCASVEPSPNPHRTLTEPSPNPTSNPNPDATLTLTPTATPTATPTLTRSSPRPSPEASSTRASRTGSFSRAGSSASSSRRPTPWPLWRCSRSWAPPRP